MVTSRATGDDLIDDPSDIMARPRKPPAARSAPAKTDAASDGTADGSVSPNGTPAAGKDDAPGLGASANGTSAAADDTIADGVPAFPADTIGSSRGTWPKESGPDQETAGSKAGDQSPAGDPPAFSFGPPPSAPAQPAVEDPTIAYPAESAVIPPADGQAATAPAGTVPSWSPSRSGSRLASWPGLAFGDRLVQGRPPAGSRPAPAEPSSVSPAAFAWEMPDPPPNSPSSPARTFLRSGMTGKKPAARKAAAAVAAGKTAAGEAPAATRGATQKAQSKRTARQAHLTVARVEPWSVMKFSFVVSLVAFVILFVAVSVLYAVLSALGLFDSLQHVVSSVTSSQNSAGVNAKAWFSASKVLGYTALLGSLNIVLITAMATIGAVVYNLTSRLVGGVEVTLRETE